MVAVVVLDAADAGAKVAGSASVTDSALPTIEQDSCIFTYSARKVTHTTQITALQMKFQSCCECILDFFSAPQ